MSSHRCQLFILLFVGLCVVQAQNDYCSIRPAIDPSVRPLLERSFGSRSILKPYKAPKEDNYIYAENDEVITLHCVDGFHSPSSPTDRVSIKLRCDNTFWREENSDQHHDRYNLHVECKKVAWNLYESVEAFRWCPEYSTSYIIAKKNVNKSPTHIAGLCYDTERLLLSSVAYNIQPDEFKIIKAKFDLRNYSFGREIKNFQTIEKEGLTPLRFEEKQFEDWFTFGNFHYAPLIENNKIKTVIEEFGSLLNVTWWPSLRLGNWKKYQNALEKHTTKAAYNVISGVEGKLEVPLSNDCDNTTEMKVLVDKYDRYIPAYIWNYLEPLQNISKEVVIIAFNSPFYEFYKKDDVVFCEDICHEIDWLANVRSTFQYANMGIMFCCRADNVQKSKRFDNFPNLFLKNDTENVTERLVY
uniref:DNA/RNA non-specific endonuclease domain-containing protein n=1 Tax=Glossina austeni TaxID=7395 RepID=A0A1A9VW10_GLOAU